jgi:hypothetical protein
MAEIDPRDYQGIDATIKNVVRSIRNQLAMFIFSYNEVLLLIKDLKTKKIITERIQNLEMDDGYLDFIRDVRKDPNFKTVEWTNLLQLMKNDMNTIDAAEVTALNAIAEKDLNDRRVKNFISQYLKIFLDILNLYGIEESHFFQRNEKTKVLILKNIFDEFTPDAIIDEFELIIKDMQDPSFDPKPEPEEESDEGTGEAEDGEEADKEKSEEEPKTETSPETADPNYDNDEILKAIEPLVKQFRGLKESKSIFEESSDLKTLAKNAFERWTNSLLTTKFRDLIDFLNRFIKMIRLINVPLSNESERKDVYKWLQYVMGRSTEKLEINGVDSDKFKTFYNAFKKYNKELQDRYNEFKRTKPKLDDPSTITEGRIKREKVLKEMKIRIKESARMRNLPQGPLSQDLVARLASIDNEFLDYYRRFLTIYNKMRELPDNIKTDSNTDQLAIDFVTNLFADLNQPLSEEDMPIPKWRDIDDRYKMLYAELQNLIDLEDNFDEAKAKENINFFKREYQKFLTMLSSIAQSGKIGDQTLKLNEVKRLIIQELKVLNGKKMVRN